MLQTFRVDVSYNNQREVCLAVHGEVDSAVAAHLLDAIEGAAQSFAHHHIVVDLREVSFMDSEGLGVLVLAHRNLAAGGGSHLVVANPSAMVTRLLEITGIDSYVDVRYQPASKRNPLELARP